MSGETAYLYEGVILIINVLKLAILKIKYKKYLNCDFRNFSRIILRF